MIELDNVSKSFGRAHAVVHASFIVKTGQVVGLLGANGAGKTTTIRMIAGAIPPDAGRITVAGHDTLTHSLAARRAIGYLPEAAPAYPELAVRDYVAYRATLQGVHRRARRDAVARALHRCAVADVAARRVGHLSRGYRQRVGLAAAIVHEPPVIILDEPTSALDPRQVTLVRALIRELARDRAVLVSSHVLPEVERTCDRVVIMTRGRVRADDDAHRLAHAAGDALLLDLRAPEPDAALALIRAVPGVLAAEARSTRDGWTAVRVRARDDAARDALALALAAKGIPVRELRREGAGLERIFLDLADDATALHAHGGDP